MTNQETNYATDLASLVSSKIDINNVAEHIDYIKNNLSLSPKGFILVCAYATYMLDKENDLRNIERLITAFDASKPSDISIKIANKASFNNSDKNGLKDLVVGSISTSKTLHDAAVNIINGIRLANGRLAQKSIILAIQDVVPDEVINNLC